MGYVWFLENAKERKKKIMWKIIFFSLDDMENMMEKNIKENIKENIMIFSLPFSLKNNEKNKRKKKREKLGEILSSSCIVLTEHFLPLPHLPS